MIFAYHVAVKCRRYSVRLKAMSLVLVYFGGTISVRFGPVTISTLLRTCPSRTNQRLHHFHGLGF
jgi:hypothetical protein